MKRVGSSIRPVLGTARTEKLSDDSIPYRHHYVDFPIELTQAEFQQYLQASSALNGFVGDAQLFEIIVLNYQEYYDALHDHFSAYAQRDEARFDSRRIYLDINRCMLNWLSSVRTYLDHTEASIKRRHGEPSQSWRKFEQSCQEAYDSNLSYRFLYRMWNYAQHCGFPIHEVNFSSVPSESDPQKPAHAFRVSCNRDRLLSEYDGWGSRLKAEISELPPVIEINDHIDAMTASLERINASHNREEFLLLRESAIFIKNLLARVPPGQGEPGVFEIEVTEDETGKVTGISRIISHSVPIGLVNAVINGKIEDVFGEFVVEKL